MSASRCTNNAIQKVLSLVVVALLATASSAQEPTSRQAPASTETSDNVSIVPLTPLPQAPPPQHNAHLYSDQDYSRGQKAFPTFWKVWTVRNIPPPNLANSALIDSVIRDGKMYLSLNDAVTLSLENNLDIAIQRYNLSIADTDLLRTSSGAVALGVNAGLVQGTPGGTSGSTSSGGTGTSSTGATGGGAGGTTIGTGGAGTGAAGLVTSTQGE
jgi:hypothetical protein